MALTMTGLEIEKTSGYWRAKGFRKPDMWSVWNVKTVTSSTSVGNGACLILKPGNSHRKHKRFGVCSSRFTNRCFCSAF